MKGGYSLCVVAVRRLPCPPKLLRATELASGRLQAARGSGSAGHSRGRCLQNPPLQPLKLGWESEALRLATICPRLDSRAGKSCIGVPEVERLLGSQTDCMQDLGSRELGGRTPEAMHRAGSEGRCAELVVKTGGGIALQECPQFWDSDHGRHGGGAGGGSAGRGQAFILSVPNIYREHRDLAPGAALHWTFICVLGQTTSDSGFWVQGPSYEDLAQRRHRVHVFDHLGERWREAPTLLCHRGPRQ